jgi:hypothetical protein
VWAERLDGGDIDVSAEQIFGVEGKADQIEWLGVLPQGHQQVDVAAGPVLSTGHRSEYRMWSRCPACAAASSSDRLASSLRLSSVVGASRPLTTDPSVEAVDDGRRSAVVGQVEDGDGRDIGLVVLGDRGHVGDQRP